MIMSDIVKTYLDDKGIEFQLSSHPRTSSSRQTAAAAHVNENQLAKAVLLKHGWEYLMVVIPADSRVKLDSIAAEMGEQYEVAPTHKVESLLEDCKPGAIPPIGHVYGVETLVDESLDQLSDVYFEAGDHEHLVHVDGQAFHKMLGDCRHGRFSTPAR